MTFCLQNQRLRTLLQAIQQSYVTEFCFSKITDIDLSSFKKDIIESDIMQNPTEDLGGLVKQYNNTLSNILDKHAPLKTCKLRMRGSQPWYDKNVQTSKQKMRISEHKWRKSRHVDDYMLFSAKRSNYTKIAQSGLSVQSA